MDREVKRHRIRKKNNWIRLKINFYNFFILDILIYFTKDAIMRRSILSINCRMTRESRKIFLIQLFILLFHCDDSNIMFPKLFRIRTSNFYLLLKKQWVLFLTVNLMKSSYIYGYISEFFFKLCFESHNKKVSTHSTTEQ